MVVVTVSSVLTSLSKIIVNILKANNTNTKASSSTKLFLNQEYFIIALLLNVNKQSFRPLFRRGKFQNDFHQTDSLHESMPAFPWSQTPRSFDRKGFWPRSPPAQFQC